MLETINAFGRKAHPPATGAASFTRLFSTLQLHSDITSQLKLEIAAAIQKYEPAARIHHEVAKRRKHGVAWVVRNPEGAIFHSNESGFTSAVRRIDPSVRIRAGHEEGIGVPDPLD